jgi:hypothetical protein
MDYAEAWVGSVLANGAVYRVAASAGTATASAGGSGGSYGGPIDRVAVGQSCQDQRAAGQQSGHNQRHHHDVS